MLFRPSFCAHCGEKIERAEWGILTSRRFCQVCESEYKGHDLIPRAVVGLGVLIGVFGIGTYLKSDSAADDRVVTRAQKIAEVPASTNSGANRVFANSNVSVNAAPVVVEQARIQPPVPAKVKTETDEAAYYCGAETRKGTPCSRRVKRNTRCFQHAGMPAMAAERSTAK